MRKKRGEMLANIRFAFIAVFSLHSLSGRGTGSRVSLSVEARFSRAVCMHIALVQAFIHSSFLIVVYASLYTVCVGIGQERK